MCEAGFAHVCFDDRSIGVPMRSALVEMWRVGREKALARLYDRVSNGVLSDRIPEVEGEHAARLQHAPGFARAVNFIWKEHDPELAYDDIERPGLEWKRCGICDLPTNVFERTDVLGRFEHRGIEVGCNDLDLRR